MPGFATHYLFGVDAFGQLAPSRMKDNLKTNHSAYALGLQGPDLFFYDLPYYLIYRQNIGAIIHSRNTGLFFSNLLKSRSLFSRSREQNAADAYILGFVGHYTLDCAIHPYVYAFTGYIPEDAPSNTRYFGQHAYFETEIDNILIYRKKQIYPSQFHPNNTIRLNALQHRVIVRMLVYACQNTYPDIPVSELLLESAPWWMKRATRLLSDPSGQKKVIVRLIERIFPGRAFISPLLPSDHYRFVADPLNQNRRIWIHPWTKKPSRASFDELYDAACRHYISRLHAYESLMNSDFSEPVRQSFLKEYGSRSFQSGLPC